MNRYSKKRAKEMRLYSKLREKFLSDNPICQAGLPDCMFFSNEIHHQKGRIGKNLTDVENFLAVCSSCHVAIEHEPILAKENGHSKSRLNEVDKSN